MAKGPDLTREAMRKHGFIIAAEDREMRYRPGTEDTWKNYPYCMDIYPKQLKYVRDERGVVLRKSKFFNSGH